MKIGLNKRGTSDKNCLNFFLIVCFFYFLHLFYQFGSILPLDKVTTNTLNTHYINLRYASAFSIYSCPSSFLASGCETKRRGSRRFVKLNKIMDIFSSSSSSFPFGLNSNSALSSQPIPPLLFPSSSENKNLTAPLSWKELEKALKQQYSTEENIVKDNGGPSHKANIRLFNQDLLNK